MPNAVMSAKLRKRPRWPLIFILIGLAAVTIGIASMIQRDPGRAPAPSPPTAVRGLPATLPDTKVDLREQAVLAARNLDKVLGDRIVERLVAKGTLTIQPGGKYLMAREYWMVMNDQQKPAMATVFLMHNNLQPVAVVDPATGELLGKFQATPATQPNR